MKLTVKENILFLGATTFIIISLIIIIGSVINTKTNQPLKAYYPSQAKLKQTNGAFPIGIYYLPSTDSVASWKKLSETKINSVVYGKWHFFDDPSNNYDFDFKQALLKNIKIYVVLSDVGGTFSDDYEKCPSNFSANNSVILNKLLSYPALAGWYGLDEPYPPDNLPCYPFHEWLINNQSRRLPIWTDFQFGVKYYNENKVDNIVSKEIQNDQDIYRKTRSSIVSFDSNTESVKGQDFGSATKYFKQNFSNSKFWVVLPARNDIISGLDKMRFQVYDSIINGAEGIFWWDWPPGCSEDKCSMFKNSMSTGYSINWESIKNISFELNNLNKGLIGTTLSEGRIGSEGGLGLCRLINWRINKGSDNKLYIFSINRSTNNLNNVNIFNLPPNSQFKLLNDQTGKIYVTNSKGYLTIPTYPGRSVKIFIQN